MSKVRVHTLAKRIGMSSEEIIPKINSLGLDVKSHMNTVDEDIAKLILDLLKKEQADEKAVQDKQKGAIETPGETPPKKAKRLKKTKQEIQDEIPQPTLGKDTDVEKIEDTESIVDIVEAMTVKELAEKLNCQANEIIKKLLQKGIIVTINQIVDPKIALGIAESFGRKARMLSVEVQEIMDQELDDLESCTPRPPVITVMGHVDHGKTLLLDAIRKSNVVSEEHGGITQHIGAYKVKLTRGEVTFLDTPGHEAFTAMRARGAQITDIVILVVAADDGVMPQTIEAINHAKSANVPIVVAINKIDKPEADIQRIKTDLAKHDLLAEDWGGQTIFCEISAKKQIGLEHLLEMLLLEAEMLELNANPSRKATGTIIEAKLDRGRGPVASVLVKNGTLRIGDPFVCGLHFGRVRAMIDDTGEPVKEATPSMPVEVLGLSGVPQVGDSFVVVADDRRARQISSMRLEKQRTQELSNVNRIDLKTFITKVIEGEVQELKIILKGDVQGSVQAIHESLDKLSTDKVKLKIIHAAVGAINETDVLLAASSGAIIIGFGIRPETKVSALAERENVEIRLFTVIYDLVDTVRLLLKGILKPVYEEVNLGRAEVRQIFSISKIGVIAGSFVTEGKILRNGNARVLRDNVVVYDGKIGSLKRFKEDVREVQTNFECGIGIVNFNDIKVGDIIECYIHKEIEASSL